MGPADTSLSVAHLALRAGRRGPTELESKPLFTHVPVVCQRWSVNWMRARPFFRFSAPATPPQSDPQPQPAVSTRRNRTAAGATAAGNDGERRRQSGEVATQAAGRRRTRRRVACPGGSAALTTKCARVPLLGGPMLSKHTSLCEQPARDGRVERQDTCSRVPGQEKELDDNRDGLIVSWRMPRRRGSLRDVPRCGGQARTAFASVDVHVEAHEEALAKWFAIGRLACLPARLRNPMARVTPT